MPNWRDVFTEEDFHKILAFLQTIQDNPPTTARPSGRRASAPAPRPRAIGTVPTSAAMVVIMMGRKRTRHAS